MHLVAAIAVEKDNQTQMNRKKQTYGNCHTKINNDAVVQHMKVSTEEVKDWPVSKEFIH